MKPYINIALLFIFSFPSASFAYSECARPVGNIWSALNSEQSVWITFPDGGSPIYKKKSQLTSGQMSRFTALALTAQSTGKKLVIRYPEDGLECPSIGSARGDVQGIWIQRH